MPKERIHGSILSRQWVRLTVKKLMALTHAGNMSGLNCAWVSSGALFISIRQICGRHRPAYHLVGLLVVPYTAPVCIPHALRRYTIARRLRLDMVHHQLGVRECRKL